MSSNIQDSIDRIRTHVSPLELIFTPHPLWPLSAYPGPSNPLPRTLRISVLDSSFNPPTLAHLALISSTTPTLPVTGDYSARLLLLSVRNADKTLKPGDATYLQRIEMIRLLATEDLSGVNVAVAIVDEPTFVGKSKILLSAFRAQLGQIAAENGGDGSPSVELTFLQGFDTLERLLAPRYYNDSDSDMHTALRQFFSVNGDNSRVVCARRTMPAKDGAPQDDEAMQVVLEVGKEYVQAGRIVLMEIGEELAKMSSSEVRAKVHKGDEWKEMVAGTVADYIERERLYLAAI